MKLSDEESDTFAVVAWPRLRRTAFTHRAATGTTSEFRDVTQLGD